jgi:tripartite-type tricarboxylate transporter receptor subunit TctC
MMPATTPAEIVARANAIAVQALRAQGMKERLLNEGTEVVGNSPQEFDAFTRRELAKYEKLVKAANIKPE